MRSIDVAALVTPFGLVLARVGAFMASCPFFVADSVPLTLRAALSAMLALMLSLALPRTPLPASLFLAILGELCLGLVFGLCVRLVGLAIHFCGELIDNSVGFSFARMLNPQTNEEAGPLTRLCQLMASLTFVLADGPHTVVRQLARGFVLVPPGSANLASGFWDLLCSRFAELLSVGMRLAVPIVLTLMGVQLASALLARLAPQLNLWSIGFLATSAMGLVALWLYAPAFVQAQGVLWRLRASWQWGAPS